MKKRVFALLLCLVMLFVFGCGKDDDANSSVKKSESSGVNDKQEDGKKKDEKKEDEKKEDEEKEDKEKKDEEKSAYITSIYTDWSPISETSTLYKDMHLDQDYTEHVFGQNEEFIEVRKHYHLMDTSYYDEVEAFLAEVKWNPIWKEDHTSFYTVSGNVVNVDLQSVISNYENSFCPYMIGYSDNTVEHIDFTVDEMEKAVKDRFGLNTADLTKIMPDTLQVSDYNKKSYSAYYEGAEVTVDNVNTYGKALFELIKGIADEGLIYEAYNYPNYISECPQIPDEHYRLEFTYQFNGNDCNVIIGINVFVNPNQLQLGFN